MDLNVVWVVFVRSLLLFFKRLINVVELRCLELEMRVVGWMKKYMISLDM